MRCEEVEFLDYVENSAKFFHVSNLKDLIISIGWVEETRHRGLAVLY